MAVEMIEAYVQAGSVATSYLRTGNGAPVILLTQRKAAELIEDPLVHALAAQFRLIVPCIPAGGFDAPGWLRNVMACLGMDEARVLVDTEVPE
jgi:hypothetical protein